MPSIADLDVFPLCLGGNVFGWTADREQSFAVLDAYAAAGGNFIDTADSYSAWIPGNAGGESETIIGAWMAARGNRDEMIVATKVAKWDKFPGLSAANLRAAAEGSLERLQTDRIDLYYTHEDDPSVPIEETLGELDKLVSEGKVRRLGASNFTTARLAESLAISERDGLASYAAVQPQYSLVERDEYEGELQDLIVERGLACAPYFALAMGFLTGKYRPGGDDVDSPRAGGASRYLQSGRGERVLAALDEAAGAHGVPVASVALAWLLAQPGVVAPIASARTPEQLADLLPVATLQLTDSELQRLTEAGA